MYSLKIDYYLQQRLDTLEDRAIVPVVIQVVPNKASLFEHYLKRRKIEIPQNGLVAGRYEVEMSKKMITRLCNIIYGPSIYGIYLNNNSVQSS
jgi:hypothetical protein